MLFGKKVRLRAIEKDDLSRFVKWFSDPEVSQHLAFYAPMSLAQEEQWFADVLKRPVEEQPLAIEIPKGRGWEHIGGIGFQKIDWRCRSAEFGIHIGEKGVWNKGFGADSIDALIRYGFETLNLNRIWLRVYDGNLRAIHLYEKIGFKKEGTLREAQVRQGRYWDVFLYSILRREWEAPFGGGQKER